MDLHQVTKPGAARLLTVTAVMLFIAFGSTLRVSTRAGLRQTEALRLIAVESAATAAVLGASASQHLSGSGSAGSFDVNLSNIRARAAVTGDFNNDGTLDIALGAPDSSFTVTPPGGSPQTRTSAGTVYVIFGGSALAGIIDTNVAQGTVKVLGGKTGDKLGFSVASGDVNGDGIKDLVMGAPGADFPGGTPPPPAARADTGAVFVVLGSATFAANPIIDLGVSNVPDVAIFGVKANDQFGDSVAIGNVGGLSTDPPTQQEVADILMGAPASTGPDASPRPGGGAAYVVFGGSALNRTGGATTVRDLANQPANVVVFGRTGDALGASVAVGDVNGGGASDLILGAPLGDRPSASNVPAATDCGAVFAIFGGDNLTPTTGTSKSFDIAAAQQNLSVYGAGNIFNPGTDDADHFGVTVAAGDVTGDGIPDLLTGSPDADGPSEDRSGAGEAYVIQGGPGLNPTAGSEKRIDLFNRSATLTVYGAVAGDHFGSAVNAGSYHTTGNADTIPDFLVGAPGAGSRAGAVSIVFGGANLLLLPSRDLFLAQDDLRVLGSKSGDLTGKALRIRETLTTTDTTLTPSLQDITATITATGGTTTITETDDSTNPGGFNVTGSQLTGLVVRGTGAPANLELQNNPALTFNTGDGNDFVQVNNSPSLRPGANNWTVEFWIHRTGTGSGDPVPIVSSRSFSTLAAGWTVALDNATNKVLAIMGDGTKGFSLLSASSVGTGPEHWAVVFDRSSNQVSFYRNGALDSTSAIPSGSNPGPINQNDPVLIGGDNSTRFLNAVLDDIRIWNVARTPTQVSDNRVKELTGSEAGLAAYWKLNEASGAAVSDSTANANIGTITGAVRSFFSNRFGVSGQRTSPTYSLVSSSGALVSSSIVFNAATPTGTSLKVETSVDNGVTFQVATSGQPVPSLGFGDELGWAIAAGDVNNDKGGDLILGAPFATASTTSATRLGAGLTYVLGSTVVPPPPNRPPNVRLIGPNGGETLKVGNQFDITWDGSDPDGNDTIQGFRLELSTNGGSTYTFIIAPNIPGALRTFKWTVPVGFLTTQGRIRVIVTDNQGVQAQDDSDGNFTIADTGISVTLTGPNGGESLKFGQQVALNWLVPPASAAQVKGFDLYFSSDGGATYPVSITTPSDPTQPALGPAVRTFQWTVPAVCTTAGRISVVATSVTNLRTSDGSDASFSITDIGPTISTSEMFLFADSGRMRFVTLPPTSGNEVKFANNVVVEVSTDATGASFVGFSKPPKIKADNRKLITKGILNGQDASVFFPNGATRLVRVMNPPCAITLLRVMRSGDQLIPVASAFEEAQRVWQ